MLGNKKLIVGLGNPGKRYEGTRHNFGFMVVESLAQKLGWLFKRSFSLKSRVASGLFGDKQVFLLLPETYMNLSGEAVTKMIHLRGFAISDLIVVVDDKAIPFGAMRLRPKGSSGGHNGLKSVEHVLRTQDYLRLRMGIGADRPIEQSLEHFVLSRFSVQEQAQLPELVSLGVRVLEHWLLNGTESALQQAGSET